MHKNQVGQDGAGVNGGEFASKSQTADAIDLSENEWAGRPPTRREVDEAREAMIDAQPPRPRYRGDWERINGGTGPTLGQHQAYVRERGYERDAYNKARVEYEQMFAAWSASDKSQDADEDVVRCWNCGFWFDEVEFGGKCPECGVS